MKTDRSWSMDIKPIYGEPQRFDDGVFYFQVESFLKAIRVALKSGNTEVLTFHAVRPIPAWGDDNDHDFMTIRTTEAVERDYDSLDLNPLKQLMADAELGRKVREAGLELK